MSFNDILNQIKNHDKWNPPSISHDISHGDMPGDKLTIYPGHIEKANVLFPKLLEQLSCLLETNRAVISISGGSGVGKSGVASVLTAYFKDLGIGCYTLSGDNYPKRFPVYNDAERLHIFREHGLQKMIRDNLYTQERFEVIQVLQEWGQDADSSHVREHPWFSSYLEGGREGLSDYLGTPKEIRFDDVTQIINEFKSGADSIYLKRMGREETQLWYEEIDFRQMSILMVEWTHGNSDYLKGIDIPILLNSTPHETMEYRKARNRDGGADSPFTTTVLEIEQTLLEKQAHKAKIILSKNGEILSFGEYCHIMKQSKIERLPNNGPMLNAYPDSMGGTLTDIADFLENPQLKNVFSSFYILPSVFHTDLDRGFSVIDYSLDKQLAKEEDLKALETLGIDLKLDFILNHASVLSPQFQDILKNGEQSKYKDFFINWNHFWEGYGEKNEEGYIVPKQELIQNMFFRKPGLPILMVRFPEGKEVPYWNTFYQKVQYPVLNSSDVMEILSVQYRLAENIAELLNRSFEEGKNLKDISFGIYEPYREKMTEYLESKRHYLGQMDLNIKSSMVWEFYEDTLKTLAGYGAKIVRLDAFAYGPKEPGEKNFLNEPGTWELLEKVRQLADKYQLSLLPEIHAGYEDKIYEKIAEKGYMTYDFFLPGLVIDALEEKNGVVLTKWAKEIYDKKIATVNMLGCHDGIPLLDLKGLIPEERIQRLIDTVVGRGGYVKNLHGQKNIYYQVNATYYSALGEDDKKMLLARALQLFMPGKPQVWYLDFFAGTNDYEGVKRAGTDGHKEINRTNLTKEQMVAALQKEVVQKQLHLLRFRSEFPAFGFDGSMDITNKDSMLTITWEKDGFEAVLNVDFKTLEFDITGRDTLRQVVYDFASAKS